MTEQDCQSFAWVSKLVEIDTTSRNSNLGLIELVRDHMIALGLKPILTFDRTGAKANLFCTVPDVHGGLSGGWVLSGHTDVVPAEGQEWCTDPFKPTIVDQNLYGRGTSDMKGFIGVALGMLPALLQRSLATPLHLALSFDEEVGCLGVPLLLKDITERGIKPAGCIVGEPTCMQIVASHKGFACHRCTVKGWPAHSSLPSIGVNSIEHAAEIILFIRGLAAKLRAEGPFDAGFEVPYSSVQVATIGGGDAINIVPGNCNFQFTVRDLPVTEADDILEHVWKYARDTVLPKMKIQAEDTDIVFTAIARAPSLRFEENSGVIRLMRALLRDGTVCKASFTSEAGLFQRAGIQSVVCGPGDIRRAHRPNEYVELRELEACEAWLEDLVETMTLK